MIPWTRTKIVATLGPASAAPETLRALVKSGVDVFRFNYAHGTHAGHGAMIKALRSAARKAGATVGILQDLPGPKMRVGVLPEEGLKIAAGQKVIISTVPDPRENLAVIPLPMAGLVSALRPGHNIFIADGTLRFRVLSAEGGRVLCRAQSAGLVRAGNGVNAPDTPLKTPAFTRADAVHMLAGLRAGVDFVGLSFVSGAEDVLRARHFAARHGHSPFLIAKIERPAALKNLREIARASDGIMVARGDLGVEIPFARIPGLQADIVRQSRREGKPVIVATQVLESMIASPRPTRAEATDIAHAVWTGADAIMLSGETSIGKYPVEAVRALQNVIAATERRPHPWETCHFPPDVSPEMDFAGHAIRLAEHAGSKLLVTLAKTGATARLLSRARPKVPVAACVGAQSRQRRLAIFWGVKVFEGSKTRAGDISLKQMRTMLLKEGLGRRGDRVTLVQGGLLRSLIQTFAL